MTLEAFAAELRELAEPERSAVKDSGGIPLLAKWAGPCLMCISGIFEGDPVLYFPREKGVVCAPCALAGNVP